MLLLTNQIRQSGKKADLRKQPEKKCKNLAKYLESIDVNKHKWRTRLATVQSVCVNMLLALDLLTSNNGKAKMKRQWNSIIFGF